MTGDADGSVDVLPAQSRLLHIGVPKTGTTALQQAASRNRHALLRHGVRYPGSGSSHRLEVAALMGRDTVWTAQGPAFPTPRAWRALRAEVDADPRRRASISHEYASAATLEQALRFRNELGPDLHVVVTVRNYSELLSSRWQQYVKAGLDTPFEEWLGAVLHVPSNLEVTPGFHKNSDQGAIVDLWSKVVGAGRVTVVVVDKTHPHSLARAFGALLGVPADLLQLPQSSRSTNRSLTMAEAELIRELNVVARQDPRLWSRRQDLVRSGVIRRLQSARRPRADEHPPRLPTWAAHIAQEIGCRHAHQIASTGCRVIGNPALLHAAKPTVTDLAQPEHIPLDAALEALVGMMRAGARVPPRRGPGRPLGESRAASRWGKRLGLIVPARRLPPSLRRHVHFVRQVRRGRPG